MKFELTTLVYLEKDGAYLMMHRNKKKNDENHDRYIGVGGHLENFETPEECAGREVREETGLCVRTLKLRGLLTFVIDDKTELAWLYTSADFTGRLKTCSEGDLRWVLKSSIQDLPLWEGDKAFFRLLDETENYFSLKIVYKNDRLTGIERVL